MYDYNRDTIPLLIRLYEMTDRYIVFKDGKTVNFTSDDEELLKKYKEIIENVSNKKGKEFSINPSFENEYGTHIKSKIHKNKTCFRDNEIPKKHANYR